MLIKKIGLKWDSFEYLVELTICGVFFFADHFFSILRAQSSWVNPSSFTFAISSPLRDRDEARDDHLDPTTLANDWRNSASGLSRWFCWSSSFFCRST